MKKSKEFLVDFLKNSGADESTVEEFGRIYDEEFGETIKGEQGEMVQERRERQLQLEQLANEANIRRPDYNANRKQPEGMDIQAIAEAANIRK